MSRGGGKSGVTVRWFNVRNANIDENYRQRFEELGVEIVRAYFTLPSGTLVWEDETGVRVVRDLRVPMQSWLREQHDRTERKDSWLMTMEIAITILVAAELVMSVLGFYYRNTK